MRVRHATTKSSVRAGWRRFTPLLAAVSIILAGCSGSGPQSALEPEGPIARDIDGLWILVFVLATIVFVLVTAAYLVAIWRFRERKNDTRRPKQLHGNTRLEIVWTIIPAVILAVIAVPTVQGVFDVRSIPDGPDVVHVNVTGHQWWWEFEFPDLVGADGRPLRTANELHIPAGREVLLTMTSADVIHSFWVPPLNGKRDVVPGKVTNLRLVADPEVATKDLGFGEGWILGQCAEFCGLAHADMRMRVKVHDQAGFDTWVDEQLTASAVPAEGSTAAAGWETFNLVCTACHHANVENPDGSVEQVGPPEFFLDRDGTAFHSALAPDLTHFGSRTTFGGASFDNVNDHLAQWLANPADLKPMDPDRNDIPNRRILGMPNFGLDQAQIEGLLALLDSWQ